MKIMRLAKQLSLFALLTLAAVPDSHAAWNAADGVYYLKTSDGLEETFAVSGQMTFKSQAGTTISGYRDCGVVFAPANPGEVVQVTVKSIDLDGGNYLLAYDGAIEQIKSGTSDGKGQSSYLPAGWKKKFVKGMEGETYTSTSADGKLSFGFHSGSANNQKGFTLIVESVSLKDMEFVGAEAFASASAPRRGEKNAKVMGIRIMTDGSSNPLSVDGMVMDCSALSSSSFISNVRLTDGAGETLASLDPAQTVLKLENRALRSGRNEFYIVADVAPDASGEVPVPVAEALTVGSQSRRMDPASVSAGTFADIVWMASGNQVFTIGSPVDFYDDGGPEGKISEKFEGTVTFVPATEGHAVKVDFTQMAIFNTSSTGMNDVLKVYNGREADEANLITTLLKEPEVVKSTAADGSLTVKLTSKTGNPAQGWVAKVSQFLPGDMTLSSVVSALPDDAEATVHAAQADVPVMLVDVVTDNTVDPLSATSFKLSATNPGIVGNVKVWYLGKKAVLDSRNEFGSAAAGESMEIGGSQVLSEGHNWFAMTAGIADDAKNDAAFSLSVSSVTVGGNNHELQDRIVASRTVRNIWHSREGDNALNVYDTWQFLPTFNSATGYQDRYAAGQADQTITFVPSGEGEKIQIDFSSFALTYAGSVNAKFEIYSGRQCVPEAMLWNLSSSADKNIGPARTLRSAAADGSMTIRFNPNTTQNYYCAKGWEATVKPFLDHDMSVVGSSVTRTETREMPIGAKDQEMLDFSVVAEGTLSVKTVKSVKLSVEGHEAVAALKVMTSLNSDMTDATLFGESDEVGAETVVAGDLPLSEGPRYFRVLADIRPDAEAEVAVRVGVLSVTDDAGTTDMISDGNPEGSRTVKSILYLESGTHQVTVARSLMWYDDGGADGKISSRIASTYTFVPAREGYAVTLNSTQFSIGNGKMYVYSGREADKNSLLGTVTGYGTTNGPKSLTSKAGDGTLTVTVSGPSGSTLDGFAIEVGLHEKVDYTLEEVNVSSAGGETAYLRGSRDLPVARVAAVVAGDQGASEISGFRFSLAGTDAVSDLKSLSLYYGAAADGFSPAICEKIATVAPSSGEVEFEVPTEPGDNGTFNYWLTADIADDAAAGNRISVALTSVDFNGVAMAVDSESVEGIVKAGLKGTFTIGASGADYADFKSAAQALSQGVEGPVVFEILDGTYAECLKVDGVKGTSAEHSVVFRSKSGNRDAVKITGKYLSSDKDGIVQVKASPYVAIENISVDAGSQAFSNAVYVGEKSPGFRMSGCSVSAAQLTGTVSSGIRLVYSHPVNEAGGNNDFMTVENSSFQGGYIGLYLGGTMYVALPKEKGLVVRGNTVKDCYAKGIYLTAEDAPVVEGNIVSWSGSRKGYQGMDLYRVVNGASIRGNRVYNTGTGYSTGVDFRDDCAGIPGAPLVFANNEVVLTGSDAYSGRAVNIRRGGCGYIDIDCNTLRVGGTDAYVLATNSNGASPEGIRVRGNIFHNECTKVSTVIYFWDGADHDGFLFGKNAYWGNSGTVCKNDTENLDFDGFTALSGDAGSVFSQPVFTGATDSHLAEAGDFRCGLPVDGIADDLEGTLRPLAGWTLGAYEYSQVSHDAPAVAEGYPAVSSVTEDSAAVKTKWKMGGTLYGVVREWHEGDEALQADEIVKAKGVPVFAGEETATVFSSLVPSTCYKAFFVAESAAGVRGEVVVSDVFTTLRRIEPLSVVFDDEETPRVESGDGFTIVPGVSGGDLPYVYEWTDQSGRKLGADATLTVTPEVSACYTLKVVSADGQTTEAKTAVEVTGKMAVATFDDNLLAEESHRFPADDERFYSGSFAFNAGGMPKYNFWYGYTLSSETSSEFGGLSDQFRSAPGGAFSGSSFAVGYPQGLSVEVTNDPEGDVIPGFYVANSAYALSSMTFGDGYARKFAEGDWFRLTARAKCADGSTKTKDFYLADLRDASEAERYILSTWEWMDLRSLGKVKSVTFTFDSSDKGSMGVNTPTYLCLDDFGSMPRMETYAVGIPAGGSVDLADYFEEDGSEAATVYSVETLEDVPSVLNVDGSCLRLESMGSGAGGGYECMASMRQRGKTQYARLLVSEGTNVGVGSVAMQPVRVYPVPVVDRMNVQTGLSGYSLEIFAADGTCVFRSEGNDGDITVMRDGWSAGVYVVRIVSGEGVHTERITVK